MIQGLALGRSLLKIEQVTSKDILAKRGVAATEPEAISYLWLESRGYSEKDGTMEFQSSLFGGRQIQGGMVVDFILYTPTLLSWSILGDYWHRDPTTQDRDEANKARLEREGIPMIYIREDHIYAARDAVLEDALHGIEWEQL